MKNKLVFCLFLLLSCVSIFAMDRTFVALGGEEIGFSAEEIAHLNSKLLNGLFEELSSGDCGSIPVDINPETLEFIKKLLNSDDKDTVLEFSSFSQNNDWTDLINALEYLQAEELLNYVIEWMSHHVDFTRFNGSNICTKELLSLRLLLIARLSGHILPSSVFQGALSGVLCAIAPDNSFVVTRKYETLKIWRLNEEGKIIGSQILNNYEYFHSVAVASDGSFVMAVSNFMVRVWFLDRKRKIIGEDVLGRERPFHARVIGLDGPFLIRASRQYPDIKIWSLDFEQNVGGMSHYGASDWVEIPLDSSLIIIGRAAAAKIRKRISVDDLQNLTLSQLLFIFKLGQSKRSIDLRREPKALEVTYESLPQKLKQKLRGHIIEKSIWDKIKRPCLCATLLGGASYLAYKLLKK